MTYYEYPQMKYSTQKGLISIIVPIYNTNETYLRECLDNIISQTFTNWEVILVNDGSTDNTVKIIDEYAKKDSRFVAVHKQNQGTLLARKTGLENSKGEFIASIDSDDILNSQFLEKMYSKITETIADFVWCRCTGNNIFNITNYNWNKDASKNCAVVMNKSQGMAGYTWNKLIKREVYKKVHFPNIHLTLGEDPVQILQVAYHSKSAEFVPENLYFYRTNCGVTAKRNFISEIKEKILVNEVLELLFNGTIPYNVKNAFYLIFNRFPYIYFSLSKKERQIFGKELKPLLQEFIKHEKKLRLKIIYLFASRGIEFPFRFYQLVKSFKLVKFIRRLK